LAGAPYVPQISDLITGRCSAGISRLAFEVWLLASLLATGRAVAIHAGVFIALGGIQIVATALIMLGAIRFKDTPCPSHPVPPPATWRITVRSDHGVAIMWTLRGRSRVVIPRVAADSGLTRRPGPAQRWWRPQKPSPHERSRTDRLGAQRRTGHGR
jgi:hypothetical protein